MTEPERPQPPRAGPESVEDARGLLCPLPLLRLAAKLPKIPVGAVLTLLVDDPLAPEDVRNWCVGHRQDYLGEELGEGHQRLHIRRLR